MIDVKPGQYAKYKGSWAYVVCLMDNDQRVMLSGWRGLKTMTVERRLIKEVKEGKGANIRS